MNETLYSAKLSINSLPVQFAILWGAEIGLGDAWCTTGSENERSHTMKNEWEFEELLVLFNEWSDEFLSQADTMENVCDFCKVESFFDTKTKDLALLREQFEKEHDVEKIRKIDRWLVAQREERYEKGV